MRQNQAVGLRTLANGQTATDEAFIEVLEMSEDPDGRAEVYLQLPQLVDDPPRALALIDRLRRRTRNGDDLYHLDLACELVARRHAVHATEARGLRDCLYDHIPRPRAGLFETLWTIDDEIDLWCEIPAGRFSMGSPDDEKGRCGEEGPQHEVVITSPFRLAAVPVTQEQYAAFDPGHHSHTEGAEHPVERVSWWAAMAFCRWLASHEETAGARLPSEEEWEYACRAGTTTRYWSGHAKSALKRAAWFGEGPKWHTHPVAERAANPWGLFDMHGNVWEWCTNRWPTFYTERQQGLSVDPAAIDATDLLPQAAASADFPLEPAEACWMARAIRGGSTNSTALGLRSACRGGGDPFSRAGDLGFRVLLPSPQ